MATITQDMKYKQSLMKYATAHGVSKASRKYNRARSFIYFWLKRWDGNVESLRPESRLEFFAFWLIPYQAEAMQQIPPILSGNNAVQKEHCHPEKQARRSR